jgi:hypothetical protein
MPNFLTKETVTLGNVTPEILPLVPPRRGATRAPYRHFFAACLGHATRQRCTGTALKTLLADCSNLAFRTVDAAFATSNVAASDSGTMALRIEAQIKYGGAGDPDAVSVSSSRTLPA